MKLNPRIPLSDTFQARIAAQSILRNGFDPKRTVAELRPGHASYNVFFSKLMDEPAVRYQLERIMNRTDRNAEKFLKMNWELFEKLHETVMSGGKPERELLDAGLNANRILAKGYVSEKKSDAPEKPMRIDGLGDISTLVETKPEKVQ